MAVVIDNEEDSIVLKASKKLVHHGTNFFRMHDIGLFVLKILVILSGCENFIKKNEGKKTRDNKM